MVIYCIVLSMQSGEMRNAAGESTLDGKTTLIVGGSDMFCDTWPL